MGAAFRVSPAGLDGDCDVAALVYRPGEDPDRLLAGFAASLVDQGFDPIGLIQRRIAMPLPDGHRQSHAMAVPIGKGPSVFADPLLDTDSPRTIAAELAAALVRGPDLLILNRFGSLERSGAGLIALLAEAARHDVPVVIAVPAALFSDWLTCCEGLAVKLACRQEDLAIWWRGLGRQPYRPQEPERFCERFK